MLEEYVYARYLRSLNERPISRPPTPHDSTRMAALVRLNALRVIAEAGVVHHHFYYYQAIREGHDAGYTAGAEEVANDLMCFFFVLSGFVAMYSNRDRIPTTWDFMAKRLCKTFPLYLLTTFISFLSRVSMNSLPDTHMEKICAYTEFFLLSAWLPCRITPQFNGAGWYIATLYWLWLCFPRLQRFAYTPYAWGLACCVWIVSTGLFSVVWIDQWAWQLREFPPLRLCEFFIGMLACSTVPRQVPTWVAWCSAVIILGYWVFTVAYLVRQPTAWAWQKSPEDISSVTDPNKTPFDTGPTHTTRAALMQGKFALLWAVILQWVACSELHSQCDSWWVRWLGNTIFKLLSPFSLQLYLCHQEIHQVCESILRACHWEDALQIHTYYLIAYTGSYMIFLWLQPVLDRMAVATGTGIRATFITCCKGAATLDTQPLPQTPRGDSPSNPMGAV